MDLHNPRHKTHYPESEKLTKIFPASTVMRATRHCCCQGTGPSHKSLIRFTFLNSISVSCPVVVNLGSGLHNLL